jgi:hypothetical protein
MSHPQRRVHGGVAQPTAIATFTKTGRQRLYDDT